MAVMSTLEDRLAAALKLLADAIEDSGQEMNGRTENELKRAAALLAEYDASREACKCDHTHRGSGHEHSGNFHTDHLHIRAHCQPAEPAL